MTASSSKGFTLVELLVSITIFAFLIVTIVSLFSQALVIQRRALAFRYIAENAQFVIESVSREVRVSSVTSPNTTCNPPTVASRTLTVDHPINGSITYAYDAVRGAITRQQSGFAPQDITTNTVFVSAFAFCVTGSGGDGVQARVTMPMSLRANPASVNAPTTSLQTTISSRDLIDDLNPPSP